MSIPILINISILLLFAGVILYRAITNYRHLAKRQELNNLFHQAHDLINYGQSEQALALLDSDITRKWASDPELNAFIAHQRGIALYHLAQSESSADSENLKNSENQENSEDPNVPDTPQKALQQAIPLMENAASIYRSLHKKNMRGNVLNDLGKVYFELAKQENDPNLFQKAVSTYKEALSALDSKNSESLKGEISYNLGISSQHLFQSQAKKDRFHLKTAINALETAIEYYQKNGDTNKLARTQLILGTCHLDLGTMRNHHPDRDELQQGLDLAKAALQEFDPHFETSYYAQTQFLIGQIYLQLSQKDHRRNLCLACRAFLKARQIYQPTTNPMESARVSYYLSQIYQYFAESNHRLNRLNQTRLYLDEALKMFTLSAFPFTYVSCQLSLGALHLLLADQEKPKENLTAALQAYQKALKVYSIKDEPTIATKAEFKSGIIRYRLSGLDQPLRNINGAILSLEAALKINHFAAPEDAAQAEMYLGRCYLDLALLDPTTPHLQKAAEVYPKLPETKISEDYLPQYLQTGIRLGKILLDEAKSGHHDSNPLPAACSILKAAATVVSGTDHPQEESEIADLLGEVYLEAAKGEEPLQNLKNALANFEKVEKAAIYVNQPQEQIRLEMNQCLAYRMLSQTTKKAADYRKASQVFETFLKEPNLENDPVSRVKALLELGIIYRNLALYDTPKYYLGKAIANFEKAMGIEISQTNTSSPNIKLEYAITIMRMADISDPVANLSKAIELFETLSRIYQSSENTEDYGMILNYLGVCYQNLSEATPFHRMVYIDRAIHHLEEALKVFPADSYPANHAMTQNNLGTAYSLLASLTHHNNSIDNGVHAFETALSIYSPSTYPEEYQKVINNLTKLKNPAQVLPGPAKLGKQ